jgi:glutamate racemase
MIQSGPIGIFDSGYGGLTVLKEIVKKLPNYDYVYMGDNARAPYGTRSFDAVYEFTLQCVKKLYALGCPLIILACNTASAKALRTIQQKDLPQIDPSLRVLGVIRPSAEIIGNFSKTKNIGILGTPGTVNSLSYLMEIEKFFPDVNVYQEACPMWVPLIENNEHNGDGSDYFVKKNIENLLNKNNQIDTIILGCTHYPLLLSKIKKYIPENITIVSQGSIIADSLQDYLFRHPEIEKKCSKSGTLNFYTTESADLFDRQAAIFYETNIQSKHISV